MVPLTRPSPLSERRLVEALGALEFPPSRIDRVAASLTRRYLERWRRYHTLDHVAEMFARAETHRAAIADPIGFALAIWYHDAVYRPRRTDNEAQSARLLTTECGPAPSRPGLLTVPPTHPSVVTASRLILATAGHDAPADLADGPLFLDLDLAILGAAPADYRRYAAAIREEFRWVPSAVYRAGRVAVLTRFLARPAIYRTAAFAGLDAAARRNLTEEVAALDPSGEALGRLTR